MFKKRLKGLLAMLLAGSIAATALPLTASAGIIGDITVYNGDTSKELNYANLYSDTLVSGNLNSNSLWGVYYNYSHHNSGEIIESGTIVESVSGDKLLGKIGDFDGRDLIDYSDVKISAQHKYIVTTEDPTTTSISIESVKTTSTFPLEISLSEYGFTASPLIDHYSCTAWYGVPELNSTIVSHSSLVESNVKSVTSSADSKEITVGMEAFAGLYSADIDTVAEDKAEYIFENGITILQLKSEYKTLSLPVKNALLRQETDSSGDDRHISVSKDSESLLDEGDYYFYLCYYDEEQQSFKISDSAKKYEKDVWDVINAWVNEDPNLDTNKLFLCRKVTVNVNNGNGVDTDFNTKDLLDYLIVNQGNSTTNQALLALFTAKPNSIWEVNPRFTENPSFYTYQKDAATSISDFLLKYPHEKRLNLFEQSSIRVTALDPKTNGEIEWGYFIESKLLDKNGEPRKISDYFNDLFAAVPQKAGKKYDTDGWQLWAGVTSCGGLYDFSKVELDKKPDSIGVTELNKMKNSIAFVYFPQVEIAPSLEVTAPVAGETPSTQYKILDTVGGYSVDGVEWDCDYTLLVANDKFEAGKKYRVKIDLLPDGNLSFVDSTPVTINGKEAFETILDDAYFSVYQVFTTAPEKPVNVKATAGDGKVDLSWEDGEGAYGYNVYFYNKDGTLTEIARTQNNSCTVENLENGTKYGFVVRSVSTYGDESSYTAEDVVYATPDASAPAKPANVKAVAGDGQVTVSWNAVNTAEMYRVYTVDGSTYTRVYSGDGSATSATITGLTNGTKYGFAVTAKVNGAWTVYSETVYATPFNTKPSITGYKVGDYKVKLEWLAITNAEMYRVYSYADGAYTRQLTCDGARNVATITGLEAGKEYGFVVSAKVNGSWTNYTNKADLVYATPTGTPKPGIVGYKVGNYKVKLEWNPIDGAEMYRVYTCENGVYTRKFTCLGSRNIATVTGLVSGTNYGFVVSAKVDGAWTDYTDPADLVYATPTGDPAPVITGYTTGDGKVKLTWYALEGAEMYRVYTVKDGVFTRQCTTYTSTTATVTGLENGTEYGFVVSAKVDGTWTNYKVPELLLYATPNA